MIYPDTLYYFISTCNDPLTVGRVCMAAGGQAIELNAAEQAFYDMIRSACGDMDRRITDRRESARRRQEECRTRKREPKPESVTPVTVTPPCHSVTPVTPVTVTSDVTPVTAHHTTTTSLNTHSPRNQHSSNNNTGVCEPRAPARPRTRERGDIPPEAEVVGTASDVMGITADYARWWYAEMSARDWTGTDGARIDRRNWRAVLKAWWNHRDSREVTEARQTEPRTRGGKPKPLTAADWLLCAERCANCPGAGCSKGVKVPPAISQQPHPPEECQYFERRAE